ncbi:LisH domain-containing protein FOPNL [Tetrabaena socialis]|uniref:LisH domain-containing protein FOPNL n=1 Tax=Tetrabaena socialis TaxID=47790 RepID=A0A2J7ZP71_9CHLO|nr:LisH domain-containing protein FOPNL [Tetrabaena socialis]|eukprot:PNH02066.1 LisH domain-containing protein FOPNL [Tetrabaena socialis]
MASVEDLKDALRENLDRNGKLRTLKAQLRADVFTALSNNSEADAKAAPQISNENLLLNELIREYLVYNSYRGTASVFLPESGQPGVRPFDRAFLASHLNIPEGPNSAQLPLLYSLVEMAAKGRTQPPQPRTA